MAILLQSVWSLFSWWAIKRTLFDPYVLFLTPATIFNGGQALLEVFDLNANGLLNNNFDGSTLVDTLFLVLTALNVVHFGALLALVPRNSSAEESVLSTNLLNYQVALKTGWALFFFAAIPTIISLKKRLALSLSQSYLGLYDRDLPIGLEQWDFITSGWMVPATLFFFAIAPVIAQRSKINFRT